MTLFPAEGEDRREERPHSPPADAPESPPAGGPTVDEADSPPAGEPTVDEHRYRLLVAYDGTDFHGFASQREVRTVEGDLTEALQAILQAPVNVTCAGRTDAGVHAWGQVVSFAGPPDADLGKLRHAINHKLGPEIVVRSMEPAPVGFHARLSARSRTYRYTILNRPVPDPFRARYSWWVPAPLDLRALRLGADPFVGEHDFAAFCRSGPPGSTTVRRVLRSRWTEVDDGVLVYEVTATAFCWQMVRSMVGTLVDVGAGRLRAGDLLAILRSRTRDSAGRLAPPNGLCLWEVEY